MRRQNLSKNHVSSKIYTNLGIPKTFSKKILDTVLDIITEGLITNGFVKIKGFGTFKIVKKKSRLGRNPKTGEKYAIKPRKVILFYPSKHVKRTINEKI